jgi:hypothetical protein
VNISIDTSNMPTRIKLSGGSTSANSSAAAPSRQRANRTSCLPNQLLRIRIGFASVVPVTAWLASGNACGRDRFDANRNILAARP